jgi:hypothetical protein
LRSNAVNTATGIVEASRFVPNNTSVALILSLSLSLSRSLALSLSRSRSLFSAPWA